MRKVFEMKKSTLMLFAESLEDGRNKKMIKKQRIARAGMKLLKILEKVGKFENE